MSTSPIISPQTTLTGSSTFATDLQNSVTRAVAIASLPIQLLTADQNTVNSQLSEISQLGSLFSTLQGAIQSLSAGTGTNALNASVSDSSVLQASVTGNALQGAYTVNVLDPGSTSSAISTEVNGPVSDPTTQSLSQSNSFTLTVDGTNYNIHPAAQNLNALATAINSSGAPVQALVVNLGSPEQPDYNLIVQSKALGDVSIQLNDGTSDLLSSLTTGGPASYTVNGQPPDGISSDAATVTIAPGLNVTLNGAGTSTVTVSANTTALSNALSSFVSAYNAVVAELQKNHGQNGGALTGDGSILQMQTALQQLLNYTSSSGSITSLTSLGVGFTQQGTLSFDPSVLNGLSQQQVNDGLSFLGDPTSSGFLQFATDALDSINDPSTGLIATETQAKQTQIQQDQDSINETQARVNQLQQNLQAQMAAADALIATLQQQNQFLQGLFQASTSSNPNATTAG